MKNTNFDVTISYMNEDFTISLSSDNCTNESLLKQLQELKQERFEQESGEDFEGEFEEDFEITDWQDIPVWCQDLEILADLFDNSDDYYEIEIYEAAYSLDIPFSDVAEAYSGEFNSDEDFAENLANELGLLQYSKNWPYTCIDWEQAANELMYDYCTENNYYFRNL